MKRDLNKFNFVTEEQLNTTPAEQMLESFPKWKETLDEIEDEAMDCIDSAFKNYFEKRNLWIDYPLELNSDEYDEVDLDDFKVELEGETVELDTWDFDTLLFPLKLSRKNNDITIGLFQISVVDDVLMVRKIELNKNLSKQLKRQLDLKGFREFKPAFKDNEFKFICEYIYFKNDFYRSTESLRIDEKLKSTIEENGLNFISDLERQDGLLRLREYLQAKLVRNTLCEKYQEDVRKFIHETYSPELEVKTYSAICSLQVYIMTEGNGYGFIFDLYDEKTCEFIKFGDKDGNYPPIVRKMFDDSYNLKKNITDISFEHFYKFKHLMEYEDEVNAICYKLISDVTDDEENEEKNYYDVLNFDLLEQRPEEINKVNLKYVMTSEELESLISKIDDYAAGRPELKELKFRDDENIYYNEDDFDELEDDEEDVEGADYEELLN